MIESERGNDTSWPNTNLRGLSHRALRRPLTMTLCSVSILGGCGFRSGLDGFELGSDDRDDWEELSAGGTSNSQSSSAKGGVSSGSVGIGGTSQAGGSWSNGNSFGSGGKRIHSSTQQRGGSTSRNSRSSYGGSSSRRSTTARGGFGPLGGSSASSSVQRGGSGGRSSGGASWVGGASWGTSSTGDPLCPASKYVPLGCRDQILEGAFELCNDLDDDCDGSVDEGCACTPGAVKTCFAGPPSRRNVGACRDGLQTCEGHDGLGRWGACLGGITPQTEACDTLDNDCDGCRDEISGCKPVGSCPASGDERIPVLHPFDHHSLKVSEFYDGDARSYSWVVDGGPCDRVAPTGVRSYDLLDASTDTAEFVPRLSGDYTVSLTVEALSGELFQCTWIVPVRGPGLRVEMCYPESDHQDLDLYLKRLSTQTPWFDSLDIWLPNQDECSWSNCEAGLREGSGGKRVDWGYENSDLSECIGGPQGSQWQDLGYCANPRLDIDNNLDQGSGFPENINIDQPRHGDGFRIMVQNFSGDLAHPIVNVYCGGVRTATFGAPPDSLLSFSGPGAGHSSLGAMWRVADVAMQVADDGRVSCAVQALYSETGQSGYYITIDDPSF